METEIFNEGIILKEKRINQWVTETLATSESKKVRKRKRRHSDTRMHARSGYGNHGAPTCNFENVSKFSQMPNCSPEDDSKLKIETFLESTSMGSSLTTAFWIALQENCLKQSKRQFFIETQNMDEFSRTTSLSDIFNSTHFKVPYSGSLSGNNTTVPMAIKANDEISSSTMNEETALNTQFHSLYNVSTLLDERGNCSDGRKYSLSDKSFLIPDSSEFLSDFRPAESCYSVKIREDFKTPEKNISVLTQNASFSSEDKNTLTDKFFEMNSLLAPLDDILSMEQISPNSKGKLSVTACRSSTPSDISCGIEDETSSDNGSGSSEQRWKTTEKLVSDAPKTHNNSRKRRNDSSSFP